jgi:hypothetical protein
VTRPPSRVARVCALLNEARAKYVIVGATAMQLWGTSRATRDIDILIEPTLENGQRVLNALSQLPFGVASEITASDLVSRVVTMIGDTPNVDVLTRAWKLRWETASRGVAVFLVDDVPVPAVSIINLIASKQTGRPQDVADVLVLEAMLS